MLPDRLLLFSTPIPVLGGQGHVVLIDCMGDDARVADAARTSYQGNAALREARDTGKDAALIRRLLKDRHTSPFEHAHLTLHVRCPMDMWRQWIRHRTANVSEYSTRYKPAIDDALTTEPDAWRAQSKDNKQGSSGRVEGWPEGYALDRHAGGLDVLWPSGEGVAIQGGGDLNGNVTPGEYLTQRERQVQFHAREVYEERLRFGVAREQARKDLPLSTMTEAVWTCDLHNLLHFLSLRMDPHAQQEIREYANVIAEIVKAWCPATYEAFVDWRLEAVTFSGPEIRALRGIIDHLVDLEGGFTKITAEYAEGQLPENTPANERAAFLRKLGLEETAAWRRSE